jgi:hypothetical protein
MVMGKTRRIGRQVGPDGSVRIVAMEPADIGDILEISARDLPDCDMNEWRSSICGIFKNWPFAAEVVRETGVSAIEATRTVDGIEETIRIEDEKTAIRSKNAPEPGGVEMTVKSNTCHHGYREITLTSDTTLSGAALCRHDQVRITKIEGG